MALVIYVCLFAFWGFRFYFAVVTPPLEAVLLSVHPLLFSSAKGSSWVVVMPILSREIPHISQRLSNHNYQAACAGDQPAFADLVFYHHQIADDKFNETISKLITLYPSFFRCFNNVYALSGRQVSNWFYV